jgi:hypothetical protein
VPSGASKSAPGKSTSITAPRPAVQGRPLPFSVQELITVEEPIVDERKLAVFRDSRPCRGRQWRLEDIEDVVLAVALLLLNAKPALVTILPMPLIFAGGWYFTRYLNPRNQHYWDAGGRQASALTELLSGIRVVKTFLQEDREVRRFSQSSHRLRESRQTVGVFTAAFTALMGLLFAVGPLGVWYIGRRRAHAVELVRIVVRVPHCRCWSCRPTGERSWTPVAARPSVARCAMADSAGRPGESPKVATT